jgi:activator of HSP90 ATPase
VVGKPLHRQTVVDKPQHGKQWSTNHYTEKTVVDKPLHRKTVVENSGRQTTKQKKQWSTNHYTEKTMVDKPLHRKTVALQTLLKAEEN